MASLRRHLRSTRLGSWDVTVTLDRGDPRASCRAQSTVTAGGVPALARLRAFWPSRSWSPVREPRLACHRDRSRIETAGGTAGAGDRPSGRALRAGPAARAPRLAWNRPSRGAAALLTFTRLLVGKSGRITSLTLFSNYQKKCLWLCAYAETSSSLMLPALLGWLGSDLRGDVPVSPSTGIMLPTPGNLDED